MNLHHIALKTIFRNDYETRAKSLVKFIKIDRIPTLRQGILCYWPLIWNSERVRLVEANMYAARNFCTAWHFMIKPGSSNTVSDIENQLNEIVKKRHISATFTIDEPIMPKNTSVEAYFQICNDYVMLFLRRADLGADHPCELILLHTLSTFQESYSEASMLATLLNKINHKEYVWILRDGLSFTHINFPELRHTFYHTLGHVPPLVMQPLMHPNCHPPPFLSRAAWNADGSILAAEVGMVPMEAPIVHSIYLEWFILTVLIPMAPSYQIFGSSEGMMEKLVQGAAIFVQESRKYPIENSAEWNFPKRHIPSVMIIGSGYLEYETPSSKQPIAAATTPHPLVQLINRAYPFEDIFSYYRSNQSTVMHMYLRRGERKRSGDKMPKRTNIEN
jgi:hypothetical protein